MESVDEKALVDEYQSGAGVDGLAKKYFGKSSKRNLVIYILGKHQVPLRSSEYTFTTAIEWRKLSRMGKMPTRILSLPGSYIETLGFDPYGDELEAKWEPTSETEDEGTIKILKLLVRKKS